MSVVPKRAQSGTLNLQTSADPIDLLTKIVKIQCYEPS